MQDNLGAPIERTRDELPICISHELDFGEIEVRKALAMAYPKWDASRHIIFKYLMLIVLIFQSKLIRQPLPRNGSAREIKCKKSYAIVCYPS